MSESRATVLGSLIGDEEDFMKEINNSLTNSLCLAPWRSHPPTPRITGMKEKPKKPLFFLWRHEKIMCGWNWRERYSEGDFGMWRWSGRRVKVPAIIHNGRQGRSHLKGRVNRQVRGDERHAEMATAPPSNTCLFMFLLLCLPERLS